MQSISSLRGKREKAYCPKEIEKRREVKKKEESTL
jgi:hypothetical protein